MLVKLLKYDLKYMLKNMIIFYILTIFFAISTRILFAIDDSVILKIISQISVGCMFSMMASILINTLMRSWVRFRDSIYKDEAYLTHTLPVTKNDIYNSKLLQTLIFFVISFSVIVIGLFIAYYTKDRWILLKDFINNFTISINFSTSFFILSVLSILFLDKSNSSIIIFSSKKYCKILLKFLILKLIRFFNVIYSFLLFKNKPKNS